MTARERRRGEVIPGCDGRAECSDARDTGRRGSVEQAGVQGRQRQSLAQRQVEIGGIVGRKPKAPGELECALPRVLRGAPVHFVRQIL